MSDNKGLQQQLILARKANVIKAGKPNSFTLTVDIFMYVGDQYCDIFCSNYFIRVITKIVIPCNDRGNRMTKSNVHYILDIDKKHCSFFIHDSKVLKLAEL